MVFFSTPAQTRSPTPPPITLTLHPLLLYSQHDILHGHCTSLLWDLRETPRISVRHVAPPHITLTKHELAQYATVPRMPSLCITCGILPGDWTMKAYNPEGLTLLDVLDAIHDCLKVQLTGAEWDAISHKQRGRINAIFDLRWRLAPVPSKAHSRGVLRADCLLNHTIFGGLTPSPVSANKCILTLRRPSPLWNISGPSQFGAAPARIQKIKLEQCQLFPVDSASLALSVGPPTRTVHAKSEEARVEIDEDEEMGDR